MPPEPRRSNQAESPAGASEWDAFECDAYERRLHRLLDERAAPEEDERLGREADLSAENRELLLGQQLLLDGLELSDAPELPADFAERCVATAISQEADPQTESQLPQPIDSAAGDRSWRYIGLAVVCAALLLIAAVPLWSWMTANSQPDVAVPSPAENAPSENAPSDGDDNEPKSALSLPPAPDLADVDNPLRTSGVEKVPTPDLPLPDNEPQRHADLMELLRELTGKLSSPDGEEDLLALNLEWVDEVALGLRPVADSVGGAINVLRQNIPPSHKDEQSEDPQAQRLRPRGSANLS